jgi:hypothetical protein
MVLGAAAPVYATNDAGFAADSACVAVYLFEDGLTDSKGDNDLTQTVNSTIGYSTTKMEGAKSGDFESGDAVKDQAQITDAACGAGMPCKSGTTNRTISVCAWVWTESIPTGNDQVWRIAGKHLDEDAGRGWQMSLTQTDGVDKFRVRFGQTNATEGDAAQTVVLAPTTAFALSQWYHLAFTCDASGNYRLTIYDGTAAQRTTATGTLTLGALSVSTADLWVGYQSSVNYPWDGRIDELCIFNDVLTADEIDAIRAGTYAGPAAAGGPSGTFAPGFAAGFGDGWL